MLVGAIADQWVVAASGSLFAGRSNLGGQVVHGKGELETTVRRESRSVLAAGALGMGMWVGIRHCKSLGDAD